MPNKHIKIAFLLSFLFYTCFGQVQYDNEKEKVNHIFSLYNTGKGQKAYALAKKSLQTVKTHKSKANLNLLLGYYFHQTSQIDSSIHYTKNALSYKFIKNDSLKNRLSILAYNLFAINYKAKGLNKESKKWHLLGVELSEKAKEINLKYWHLHGLANSYLALNETDKALVAFKECLTYKNDPEVTLGSYINLGAIYSKKKQYKIANDYLLKAKKMCEQSTAKINALASILLNIGDNYYNQGLLNKALNTYYEVRENSKKNKLYKVELTSLEKIGHILYEQKNYSNASLIYTETLTKAINLNILNSQMNSYRMLALIFEKQNDFKNAYVTKNNYYVFKDSIANLEKNKEIDRLEVRYQTLQKEKAIKLLQAENLNKSLKIKNKDAALATYKLEQEIIAKQNENKLLVLQNKTEKKNNEIERLKEKEALKELEIERQKTIKYIVLGAFILLLIPIVALLINYYQKLQAQSLLNEKEKEVNQQKINALVKDQELNLLKTSAAAKDITRKKIAQEMHDSIGGNLAAIKLQFSQLNNNPDKLQLIYTQLDDTYEQVRNLSHDLLPDKIKDTSVTNLILDYTKNIIIPSNIKATVGFYPETNINQLPKKIQHQLYTIFQELSTNTIKHAKATTIDLQIDIIAQKIFFIFEDNGVGINTSKTNSGIGLTNIKNRITDLNGSFNIDSHPNRGTIFNIEIPIHEV